MLLPPLLVPRFTEKRGGRSPGHCQRLQTSLNRLLVGARYTGLRLFFLGRNFVYSAEKKIRPSREPAVVDNTSTKNEGDVFKLKWPMATGFLQQHARRKRRSTSAQFSQTSPFQVIYYVPSYTSFQSFLLRRCPFAFAIAAKKPSDRRQSEHVLRSSVLRETATKATATVTATVTATATATATATGSAVKEKAGAAGLAVEIDRVEGGTL